jgi:alanyl-tRNA synthetase
VTNRLYYIDPSCRRFDAVVTRAFEHDGRPAVTLDQTAFYPSSGGQPFDTGRLGSTTVLDVVDEEDEIVHVVAAPLGAGESVTGEIDWPRRFDHMQQHTGQHILSAAFERLFDTMTVGFHMGADLSTIDLAREPSSAEIEQAVNESNRVIWEDRPVAIRFVSKAEASRLSLRKEPTREGALRLIEIADFDLCACGGTHVDRTGAIGLVAVTGTERMRGGSRLTFVCGRRALDALRNYRNIVADGVRALSVVPGELPAAIQRLQDESKECRKQVKTLVERLVEHEGARLAGIASEIEGVRVVVRALPDWDVPGLKGIALAAVASARACVALLTPARPVSIVIACSPAIAVDANAVLTQLTERFGGRGGGKAGLAQGGGLLGTADEIASAARTLIEAMLARRDA